MTAYDELSARARWYLENFSELDLADICAIKEAALTEARADLDALRTLTPDARRLAAGILGAEPHKPGSAP